MDLYIESVQFLFEDNINVLSIIIQEIQEALAQKYIDDQ